MSKIKVISTIIAISLLLSSCRDETIIPRNTMSDIYYDIYLTEELIVSDVNNKALRDTTNIYETIFNKYGYTQEDYQKSVSYYMQRPDKFEKVFLRTKKKLEIKKVELERKFIAENKISRHWGFVDSLELFTSDTIQRNEYYRILRILFFEKDSLIPNSPCSRLSIHGQTSGQILDFPARHN